MMPVPRYPRFAFWTTAHRVTAVVFTVLLALGSEAWFPWVQGTLSSTRVFGVVPFADPLSAAEQMLAARDVATELLLGCVIVLVLYIVLGRLFCGWLCPLGLVLELWYALRERVDRALWRRTRRHLPRLTAPTWPKYYLLVFFLLLSLQVALPVFGLVSPIQWTVWALTFRGDFAISQLFLLVLGAIALLEWFVPRVFCRSLCPIGALYALTGRMAVLRVRIAPDEAGRKLCRQCSIHCPMGIDVMQAHVLAGDASVSDPECTRCGTCLDVCRGDGVLSFGWGLGRKTQGHGPRGEQPTPAEDCHGCERERSMCSVPREF